MSSGIRNWLAAVVVSALWLASCGDTHSAFDKNTNWLRGCEESSTCGTGLHCVCGVCTSVCDRNAECAAYGENAICTALDTSASACPASTSASASQQVCVQGCAHDDTCSDMNEALMCSHGACVPAPMHGADAGDGNANPSAGIDASLPLDAAIDPGIIDSSIVDAEITDVALPSVGPELASALAGACGAAFACEAAAGATGRVTRLAAGDDGFVYWTDWGSLDDLGNHRKDGAVRRAPKTGGAPEAVATDLEKPWRLWLDGDQMYWLSGEPGDFGLARGLQTLFRAPRDASTKPQARKTDPFMHVQMSGGTLMWLERREVLDAGPRWYLQRWQPLDDALWEQPLDEIPDPESLVLDGLDLSAAYLEDGSLRIVRAPFNGNAPEQIAADPPLFLATVADDVLWLIHTDSNNRDWLASIPNTGGSVTHIGSADGYYDRPQPGTNVVWLVTAQPGNASWQLWSVPKTGGEREAAFSWPTQFGRIRDDAPAPIWIADGDEAWVFGHGTLVHIRRQ